ncbi:hypothetical protein RBB50_004997 [Rhinocladiella similis]
METSSYSPPNLECIISQLTVREKASLLAGADLWTTVKVDRLGIPALKVSDGPNGARGAQFHGSVTSACFPASVSLAASFDRQLAVDIGKALAQDTKSKGAHVLLGPTLCLHRDPRGGRNFESFSEDPFLAGELASHYVLGLQNEGVGATIKHYAANEQETCRFTIDVRVSQRALREIYLKPFEIVVKQAKPWALMTSYNLVNGTHADAHYELITNILRKQWGFDGLVMSDWGGTNSVSQSLRAGQDLEMPGPPIKRTPRNIERALQSGELDKETLDRRVEAVLELLSRTGKFAKPEIIKEQAIDRPEHRKLIRQAGAQSMVLLKNTNNILPIQKQRVKSIAMLGLAKEYLGHGGGSAAVNSHHKITPYQAFEEELGSSVKLNYAEGARILRNLPPLSENIFDNEGKPGFSMQTLSKASGTSHITVSTLPCCTYRTMDLPEVDEAIFTGTFKPTVSGKHYISLANICDTKVFINEEVVFDYSNKQTTDLMAFLTDSLTEHKRQYAFIAGEEYKIRVESKGTVDTTSKFSPFARKFVGFSFGFAYESDHDMDLVPAAVEAAKISDVVIVFVGHTPTWESEGADRTTMNLPNNGSQDRLIIAAAKANPNTIIVNSTGSAITMPWIADVAAVIQAWFPGQEAGYSIADTILGSVNPSGKLPVTFPRTIKDIPSYGNFPGDLSKETVQYQEGIYVGYRHFDLKPEGILFPFGFGLSYTSFELSFVGVSRNELLQHQTLIVSADVKNVGVVAGAEVVQVYVGAGDKTSSVDRPIKTLAGFDRVALKPGESKQVTILVHADSVASWSHSRDKWCVEKGRYKIFVGTSSQHICSVLSVEAPEWYEFGP